MQYHHVPEESHIVITMPVAERERERERACACACVITRILTPPKAEAEIVVMSMV
jgi:hypothetical protein